MPAEVTKRTVLIAGPTASGKSAAALALAEGIGAEIVNADALQVYRDLSILSARPSPADLARAPHHLFGHVDASVRYSAGEWSRDAARAIADIHRRDKIAIVVGGTGLYFRALEQGLSEAPEIPAAIRKAAAEQFEKIGAAAFRDEVLSFDPEMEKLHPGDRQRHIRAWEIFHASGTSLSEIQRRPSAPMIERIYARIVIEPTRETLYAAIGARFDGMVAAGAVEEARALVARGLDPGLPAMKAVGAAELIMHLRGEIALSDAIELAKRNTRRFAKRQLTWFRNQTADWQRTATAEEAASLAFVACCAPQG